MNENTGLLSALLDLQAEIPTLPKDATNPHFGSKYTPLDTIVEKVGPLLHKHGFVWSALPAGSHAEPQLHYRLAYAPTGEVLEGHMPLLLDKASSQAMGSAITYARRYALSSVLNLVADEDDDGNAAGTNTSRIGSGHGLASEPQKKLIERLVKQKKVTAEQLTYMLQEIGADVTIQEGWLGRLSGGREGSASTLISWLKEEDRLLPAIERPSDIPEPEAGEFEHPPEAPMEPLG